MWPGGAFDWTPLLQLNIHRHQILAVRFDLDSTSVWWCNIKIKVFTRMLKETLVRGNLIIKGVGHCRSCRVIIIKRLMLTLAETAAQPAKSWVYFVSSAFVQRQVCSGWDQIQFHTWFTKHCRQAVSDCQKNTCVEDQTKPTTVIFFHYFSFFINSSV